MKKILLTAIMALTLGFAAPQQTQAAEVTVYVNGKYYYATFNDVDVWWIFHRLYSEYMNGDADIDWQFPYFIIGGGFVL